MAKPSQKDMLTAAKWLRLDIDSADAKPEIMKEVKALVRVEKWLRSEGQRVSSFCKTCSRDTKAPLFDGCMTPNCPRGYQPCL